MIRGTKRRWGAPPLRAVLLALAALASAGAFAATLLPTGSRAAVASPTLAQRLGVRTYGFAIPLSWIAAPIPGLREDDVIDILGTRIGERANATEVADGLRVMLVDERALVVELRPEDAAAIAAARARGLTLVPMLRSTR